MYKSTIPSFENFADTSVVAPVIHAPNAVIKRNQKFHAIMVWKGLARDLNYKTLLQNISLEDLFQQMKGGTRASEIIGIYTDLSMAKKDFEAIPLPKEF